MAKRLLLSTLVLFIVSSPLYSQITGSVVDADQGFTLPGANVVIVELNRGTATNADGNFSFVRVPDGDYTLRITYIGYQNREIDVVVEDGESEDLSIELQDGVIVNEELLVLGDRLRGQARALNQQKNAPNIKNIVSSDLIGRFPDPNAAEALQRVPGISIQRDQGEGRYVQIRGTDPNLSSVTINGEQIAAPEGDDRTVALDMIPADILASLEVTKAITPDMDGDAIGGAVNLNTRAAITTDQVFNVTLNTGYNNQVRDLSPLLGQGSVTFGQRLGEDNKFGYLVAGSYNRSNRASDNNEMEYDETELDELQLRDYELTRERLGLVTSLDYQISPLSTLFLNANYNYFTDQEYRRRLVLAADEVARDFKDRLEKQQIFSMSAGGEHAVGGASRIDYMLSYSYSDQNTPSDREISYVLEDDIGDFIEFSRNDPDYPQFSIAPGASSSTGVYNYGGYELDEMAEASELTTDQHFTARLNLTHNYTLGQQSVGKLQYGALGRFKSKDRNVAAEIFGYEGSRAFTDILGSFEDDDFLFNEYPRGIGLFPDRTGVESIFDGNRSDFELEGDDSIEESEAEDYEATENTYATYVMTDINTRKFSTLFGVRYEHVQLDYTANITEFDEEGDLITPIPTTSEDNSFNFLLPMVHLTYHGSDNAKLRFAWTNTFAKPRYFDLAPYRIIAREDEEIELGNPNLDPARSMNFDLMGEYYFSNVGIISAGLFYKNIRDFIFISNFDLNEGGPYDGFEATQPVNGEGADLFGFELNLQQQLTFLPGFASGFGIYANYTYTWSEADLVTEDGTARTVSLPGQAENVANLALSYEKGGFSGRISLNYAGAFIDEIRESSDSDRIYDERFQLDLSANQKITPNISVFAEMLNLTNAPLRYYNGVSSRPEQQEFYSWWGNLGVKMNF